MPGVLQIEAMAQVGGIFALSQVEDDGDYDTYFLKIQKARFKAMVVLEIRSLFSVSLCRQFAEALSRCVLWDLSDQRLLLRQNSWPKFKSEHNATAFSLYTP